MNEREVRKYIDENIGYDKIYELYPVADFWIVTVSQGGDITRYRIYDNGDICID